MDLDDRLKQETQSMSKKSLQKLRQESKAAFDETKMADSEIDIATYHTQKEKSFRESQKSDSWISDMKDSFLEAIGRGDAYKRQQAVSQYKALHAGLQRKIEELEKDFDEQRDYRKDVRKEIGRLENYIDANQELYETLLEKRSDLEARLDAASTGQISSTKLYDLRDQKEEISNELLEVHHNTDTAISEYQNFLDEDQKLTEHLSLYSETLMQSRMQANQARMQIRTEDFRDSISGKGVKSLKYLHEQIGLISQRVTQLNKQTGIEKLSLDDNYRVNASKEMPTNYRVKRWKQSPPPQ